MNRSRPIAALPVVHESPAGWDDPPGRAVLRPAVLTGCNSASYPYNAYPVRFHSIQYLRAVAAILVVLTHAGTSLLGGAAKPLIDLGFGQYGVDLFFVISGFIMVTTTIEGRRSAGDFMVRRLIRILPLYFLMTTLLCLLKLVMVRNAAPAWGDLTTYLKSILFIPQWDPQGQVLMPLLGQGWTLNFEMFFYALFAVGLNFSPGPRIFHVTAAFAILTLCGAFYAGRNPLLLTYTCSLMLEFCFGMVLAALVPPTRERIPGRWLAASAALLAVAIPVYGLVHQDVNRYTGDPFRFLKFGLPSAAIVALFVWLESTGRMAGWRAVHLVGDASYSLYLVHTFVLAVARRVWQRLFDVGTLSSHLAFIVFSTALCIGVAVLLHLFVEKQMGVRLTRAWEGVLARRARVSASQSS
jgi:exopolysaccharide production protein ExoZ